MDPKKLEQLKSRTKFMENYERLIGPGGCGCAERREKIHQRIKEMRKRIRGK